MAKDHWRIVGSASALWTAVAVAISICASPVLAEPAPSMTGRDVQVVARALGFLQPPPSNDAWVAVVFAHGDTASRQDAERVAALFGTGLRAGHAVLSARSVSADALAGAGNPAALIAAAGAPVGVVMAAARLTHIICITAALDQVEAGHCTMWVRSEPRVEIVINQAAARSCDLAFAAAFRMMVREL
jgi:hypothetical protein